MTSDAKSWLHCVTREPLVTLHFPAFAPSPHFGASDPSKAGLLSHNRLSLLMMRGSGGLGSPPPRTVYANRPDRNLGFPSNEVITCVLFPAVNRGREARGRVVN